MRLFIAVQLLNVAQHGWCARSLDFGRVFLFVCSFSSVVVGVCC